MALLGAILPAWGYHRDPEEFAWVGTFFLSLAIGIVAAAVVGRHLMRRRGLAFLLVSGCSLCCVSLCYLAMVSPPVSAWLRVIGFAFLGLGAGFLNLALFHTISPRYQADAAGTVNRGGIWYGLVCMDATLLVWGTFYAYTVPSI